MQSVATRMWLRINHSSSDGMDNEVASGALVRPLGRAPLLCRLTNEPSLTVGLGAPMINNRPAYKISCARSVMMVAITREKNITISTSGSTTMLPHGCRKFM